MKNKGFTWHCHHNILFEWCYDYKGRIKEIKRAKPQHEIKTRLKLFKFIKGKLPDEVAGILRKYGEAYQRRIKTSRKENKGWAIYLNAQNWQVVHNNDDRAWQKYKVCLLEDNRALQECDRLWEKWEEIFPKYKDYLEALHKKECGCKEWNGIMIVFPTQEIKQRS